MIFFYSLYAHIHSIVCALCNVHCPSQSMIFTSVMLIAVRTCSRGPPRGAEPRFELGAALHHCSGPLASLQQCLGPLYSSAHCQCPGPPYSSAQDHLTAVLRAALQQGSLPRAALQQCSLPRAAFIALGRLTGSGPFCRAFLRGLLESTAKGP